MRKAARGPVRVDELEPGAIADALGLSRFCKQMKAKIIYSRTVKGRSGWNSQEQCSIASLRVLLHKHLEKGDMVDVANLAMMIWNRENPKGAEK